jgi:type I restriction enzyme, S subunit
MSVVDFFEKLLGDADMEWKKLGDVIRLEKGRQLNKEQLSDKGPYPAYNGGVSHSGFTDTYNYDENTTIVSQGGASAGFVNFVTSKFYANAHCYVVLPNTKEVVNRYVYHLLKMNQDRLTGKQHGAGIPALRTNEVLEIPIPIPCPNNPKKSLEIQSEIVRILDVFTELTTELTTELSSRKKQYNHYRDLLLSFEDVEVEWKTLEEITISVASGRNKTRSTEGVIPVYGSTGLIGFTDEASYSGSVLLVARVGANAGRVYAVSGEFDVSDNTLIVRPSDAWNIRFAFHQLTHMNLNQYAVGGGQPLVTGALLKSLKVPCPSINEQARIAAVLDKFDALTNSLTEGLPREIELRQQQYQHYRDLLLSFPRREAIEA